MRRILSLLVVMSVVVSGCGAAAPGEGPADLAEPEDAAASQELSRDGGDESPAGEPGEPGAATDADEPGAQSDLSGRDQLASGEEPDGGEEPDVVAPTVTPNVSRSPTSARALIGFDALNDLAAQAALIPAPVRLTIEQVGVVEADVIAVGVNADSSLEVPPAELVGWYKFGASPGGVGSSVLAAHIAYDGVDGVFRDLASAEVGSMVVVEMDDGSERQYRIESVTDYDKEALPPSLFATEGDEQLALITCGGSFNPELRSYENNTVVVAVPA